MFAQVDRALVKGLSEEESAVLYACLQKMTDNMRDYAKSIGLEVRS